MSSPSNISVPLVGSVERVRQRTSVDLPEPDRPITTNISPCPTSKLTSRTAAVQPVRSISSRRESAHSSGDPGTFSAFGPKTFHSPSAEMAGSLAGVMAVRSATVTVCSDTRIAASRGVRPATPGLRRW